MSAVLKVQEASAKYLVREQDQQAQPLVEQFNLIAQAPGGVARLRELILTLAVQGKLLPQDPCDEPASELLKKIRAEKERLIAEGKIKRDKPLPPIGEDEQPCELPHGWEWVRFGQIANIASNLVPPGLHTKKWQVAPDCIEKGTGRLLQKRTVAQAEIVSPNHLFKPGQILYSKIRPSLSKAVLVDFEGLCSADMYPIESPLNLQYLLMYILSRPFLDQVSLAENRVKMPKLNQESLVLFMVALPPLSEQSRIVTRVEELMRLCDALEAKGRLEAAQHTQLVSILLGTLTESETPEQLAENWQRIATHFDLLLDRPQAVDALEQTILQLAVRGLLVPQDPQDEPASALLKKIRLEKDRLIAEGKIKSDKPLAEIAEEEQPCELPQGWEWVRFGQIANIASNLVPPGLHAKKWQVAPDCIEKGTGRLLKKRTVAQAEIVSPNHLFKSGQILYSKIRPSLSKAVLVDFEGLCSADMYPIESPLDLQYLLMYILSRPFLDQVSIAENRVKMPKLNQESLVLFMVALPPLSEQSRIVTRVTELRSLCADLRERLSASQSTQAHLAEALIGEAVAA